MADVVLQGKVLLPGGVAPRSGSKIELTLSANTRNAGGDKIIGRQVLHVPAGGDFTGAGIVLTPNTDLTPASTTYEARYLLRDGDGFVHPRTETWSVGATDPVNIGTLAV